MTLQGSVSINKSNEVNEEAHLELAPHTQDDIVLPGRDDASHISRKRNASSLLSDAFESLTREFDAMDDQLQLQWLNDIMLPLMNQIKVYKERHCTSSNNNSSHVSGSRAFDCPENRFLTQVSFSRQSSSARDSENALFSDDLEYLAQVARSTEEEKWCDIDAFPRPDPTPAGQSLPTTDNMAHVEAIIRSIRENLRDNTIRQ